ncbi:MAG: hypothetical protein K2R98_27975 [Gemmataceae bacterium]|nr:hypothetical protein [Gemmataceae bacterium]
MNATDWTTLGICLTTLVSILIFSKTVRLIVWQALVHPLSRGYIVTFDDGTVEYVPEEAFESIHDAESPPAPQPKATAKG